MPKTMSPIPALSLSIRPAERRDIPDLLIMIDALASQNHDRMRLDEWSLIDILFAPSPWVRILVAENHNEVVGYAALVGGLQLQFGARTMDLHHLYVKDGLRGLGVGRALIDAARATARNLGCVRLTVGTHTENTRAQAIYQASGFTRIQPRGPRYEMALN
nr:GNAT family N-acetyltransferase [uncultured Celeribacter sp.]